jgi:hypothetical protein
MVATAATWTRNPTTKSCPSPALSKRKQVGRALPHCSRNHGDTYTNSLATAQVELRKCTSRFRTSYRGLASQHLPRARVSCNACLKILGLLEHAAGGERGSPACPSLLVLPRTEHGRGLAGRTQQKGYRLQERACELQSTSK